MDDIVYFVKNNLSNRELRYSLRTLANFPHNKVWFYGGSPTLLKPDHHITVEQNKGNKWLNVREMLKLACENKDITDNFWLFNDDFFIMNKISNPKIYCNKTLPERIIEIENHYNRLTGYTRWLRKCLNELNTMGLSQINYETHTPFQINKKKALELLELTNIGGFRTLYGNYFKVKAIEHRDVKISQLDKVYIKGEYLSTDDESFAIGKVGYQIRELFPDKCKYEI